MIYLGNISCVMKLIEKFVLLVLVLGLQSWSVQAQSLFLSGDHDLFHDYERLSILNGYDDAGSAVRWYNGKEIIPEIMMVGDTYQRRALKYEFFQFVQSEDGQVSGLREKKDTDGFFKNFYRGPRHLFEQYKEDYYLQIDPLLQLKFMPSSDSEEDFVINKRGIRLTAGLGSRVHLQTSVLEIQRSFPAYLENFVNENGAVPGVVFFKNFSSDFMQIDGGYDYNIAQAMLKVEAAKFLEVSLGHGKNFIGNGFRSMILSDFAAPYFHLKLNTHIGRLHYQNIFAELQAESNRDRAGDQLITKKYFVNHYLGYSILDNLELGFSETVVFSRANQFELQYLNPIIFYRSIEQSLGSEDNVILGFNAKWDLNHKIRFYGQYSFDEFVFNELLIERRGWWGNKWGLQLGAKMPDLFGLKNSLVTVEYNLIRPYTFQHRDSISNYSHSKQSLAHPSGSNLSELLVKLDYQYNDNWYLNVMGSYIKQGIDDGSGSNYGSNVNESFNNRIANFGIDQFQGVESNRVTLDFLVSRRLFKTLMVDLNVRYRNESHPDNAALDTDFMYYGLGLRWNLSHNPLIL